MTADSRDSGRSGRHGFQLIHFEDYPELQGYQLPEWSHVTPAEGERLTAALYRIIQRDFWGRGATGSAAASKPER